MRFDLCGSFVTVDVGSGMCCAVPPYVVICTNVSLGQNLCSASQTKAALFKHRRGCLLFTSAIVSCIVYCNLAQCAISVVAFVHQFPSSSWKAYFILYFVVVFHILSCFFIFSCYYRTSFTAKGIFYFISPFFFHFYFYWAQFYIVCCTLYFREWRTTNKRSETTETSWPTGRHTFLNGSAERCAMRFAREWEWEVWKQK